MTNPKTTLRATWFGSKSEKLLPILSLTLVVAATMFCALSTAVLQGSVLPQFDQSIYQLLQGLRTPLGDQLLIAVTELGDSFVNSSIITAILVVLLLRRQFFAAGFWLLSTAGGACLVHLLKWSVQRPRPIEIYSGVSSWSFPSGHATMSIMVYGSLAILVARGISSRRRWLPFAGAFAISLLVAFSRIYLGAHWLSDVLAGLSLGWAWVALLGSYYLRRSQNRTPARLLLVTVALTLLLAGAWHVQARHLHDTARYQPTTGQT